MGTLFLVIGIVFVLSFFPLLYVTVRGYRRYKGLRLVTCPETGATVGVNVKAGKAAFSAAFNDPEFRLSSCTRWPEKKDCGQQCVTQIQDDPDGCLVREKLAAWYQNENCALCGRDIGTIRWSDRKPGVLTPDRKTLDWSAIPPEKFPEVFKTHKPVCWNCQVSEAFLSKHSDKVVMDPRPPAPRKPESRTNAAL